jgi:hypothetical protein
MSPNFSTDFAKEIRQEKYVETRKRLKLKNVHYFDGFILNYQIFLEQEKSFIFIEIYFIEKENMILRNDILKKLSFLFTEKYISSERKLSVKILPIELGETYSEKEILNEFSDLINRITTILNYHFRTSFLFEILPKDNLTKEERNLKEVEKRYFEFLQQPELKKTSYKKRQRNWLQFFYVVGKKLGVFR